MHKNVFKRVLAIMGLLSFIVLTPGCIAHAANNLEVDGTLAVGTTASSNTLEVAGNANFDYSVSSGTATKRGLDLDVSADGTFTGASIMGINGIARSEPSTTASATGFSMQAQHETDVNTSDLKGGYFLVQYRSDSATTITNSNALHILHSKSNVSAGATTATNGYGILSEVRDEASAGSLTFGSFNHIKLLNPDSAITVSGSLAGLWIDEQTEGSPNYGIVLDGDGAGADLVLGDGQDDKIYHDGTNLVLDPSAGVTIVGANNNCVLTVDNDGTCDSGTAMVVDNSIALCAVCAAN